VYAQGTLTYPWQQRMVMAGQGLMGLPVVSLKGNQPEPWPGSTKNFPADPAWEDATVKNSVTGSTLRPFTP
jgi:hypothetical protein